MSTPPGASTPAPTNAFYIAAANVATQLAAVIPTAREIGLGAANTMALTARAADFAVNELNRRNL